MMYYCHKCGYLGKARDRQKLRHGIRICCGSMMQKLNKKDTAKVRETDERLKED